jgi:hypothetical protein
LIYNYKYIVFYECQYIYNIFSAEGNLEASKPEETETEGCERHIAWMSRKRFKAE